jgi:hypothetical protein
MLVIETILYYDARSEKNIKIWGELAQARSSVTWGEPSG